MTQLLAYLALLLALNRPPDIVGKATYYHLPGRLTRNEELFDPNGLTAAVDDGMWYELQEKKLLVCGEENCVIVRVNDTGYLAEHGIVVDLSERAFRELAPLRQGAVEVKVWIITE